MRPLVLTACILALAAPPAYAQAEDPPPPSEAEAQAMEAAAKTREDRLRLHQALGLTMLGAMAVTGGLGLAYTNGLLGANGQLIHVGAASLTTGLYLGTAGMALTAPPPVFASEPAGPWDTSGLHRNLAWLHAAGMIATVGMGIATFNGMPLTQYHGIAGLTTLGLVGTSAAVITFGR